MKVFFLFLCAFSTCYGGHSFAALPEVVKSPDKEPKEIITELPIEQTDQVVIKGKNIRIAIKGGASLFKIKSCNCKEAKIFKSKNKRALIIDHSQAENESSLDLEMPVGAHVKVSGGKIILDVHGVNGSLDLEGGDVTCTGQGKFNYIRGKAGKALIKLLGLARDFNFVCGQGDFDVQYDMSDYFQQKKSGGLTFMRMPTIVLHMAQGKSVFTFPKECTISYKKMMGVTGDDVARPKDKNRPDVRMLIFIPPYGAKVLLKQNK